MSGICIKKIRLNMRDFKHQKVLSWIEELPANGRGVSNFTDEIVNVVLLGLEAKMRGNNASMVSEKEVVIPEIPKVQSSDYSDISDFQF